MVEQADDAGKITSDGYVSDEYVGDGSNAFLPCGRDQSGKLSIPFLAACWMDCGADTAQGMDQRAERNVHNELVKVTCQSDAGQ